MTRHAPQVLQDGVHGAAVVELLLKLDALARHLDADKDVKQRWGQVLHQGVVLKHLLSLETTAAKNIRGAFVLEMHVDVLMLTIHDKIRHFTRYIFLGKNEYNHTFKAKKCTEKKKTEY